jgi:hypothetical protein
MFGDPKFPGFTPNQIKAILCRYFESGAKCTCVNRNIAFDGITLMANTCSLWDKNIGCSYYQSKEA